MNQLDIINRLTNEDLGDLEKKRILNDFAYDLDWTPSDIIFPEREDESINKLANAHLVVEHGLENSAVITFLKSPNNYEDLDFILLNKFLGISYNNLVDWHIYIQTNNILFVYNRTRPASIVEKFLLTKNNIENLRRQKFQAITDKRPNPNLPSLDDALIETISFWKRNLSTQINKKVTNTAFSALFNSIIFARAVEDHMKLFKLNLGEAINYQNLLHFISNNDNITIGKVLEKVLKIFIKNKIPEYLFDINKLKIFDNLEKNILYSLIKDFYHNKFTPYNYDFSIMSKHSLSRIYEHYVSLLREDDTSQLSLFKPFPIEVLEKSFGSIYTPQFIARFLAKYLHEQLPPKDFRKIKIIDPACGSGIFLRTLLEIKCDLTKYNLRSTDIKDAFKNITGIDNDPNACYATKLSLALLYLILMDKLPIDLNIFENDMVNYFMKKDIMNEYDAIIANPPFISYDSQDEVLREKLKNVMGANFKGKTDFYLAFLKIVYKILKPGGYGLFVLPQSFLINEHAKEIRDLIYKNCQIKCIVDLSEIRVFGNVSTYVILLIFQKNTEKEKIKEPTIIAKCRENVGLALEDILRGKKVSNSSYSIYELFQEEFCNNKWILLPKKDINLRKKLDTFNSLHEFLNIREGFASGADDVFIVNKSIIPNEEKVIFIPYLPDRKMKSYIIPKYYDQYLFYPYLNGERLNEDVLKAKYKKTWQYLISFKKKLEKRKTVIKGNIKWWQPTRPRLPQHMIIPKIISPYLILFPRFSLDLKGIYAIARGPILYPKETGTEDIFLKFFLAILNSSIGYWYLSNFSQKRRGGYITLEPKILKNLPVPNPSKIETLKIKNIVDLIDKRMELKEAEWIKLEKEIDDCILELYGLTNEEKSIFTAKF